MNRFTRAAALVFALGLPLAVGAAWASAPYPVENVNRQAFEQSALSGPAFGFAALGPRTVFWVRDFASNPQLWVTDGTPRGTELLIDVCPADPASFPICGGLELPLTATPDLQFFSLGGSPGSLWRTDGERAGTYAILRGTSEPVGLLPGAGLLVLSHRGEDADGELWVTDGTVAGSRLLADLVPGPTGSFPGPGALAGDRLVFPAQTPEHGREVWVTDGTSEGTLLLADVEPGPQGSSPGALLSLGDRVLFTVVVPASPSESGVVEFWSSDGTPAGTGRISAIPAGREGVDDLRRAGSRAVFTLSRFDHPEVWGTDGTNQRTHRLSPAGVEAFNVESLGAEHFVFLTVTADGGAELWITDGTRGSTRRLIPLCEGPCNAGQILGPVGDGVLFLFDDGAHGGEPWFTDGTVAGTRLVRDLCPGECSSIYELGGAAVGRFFFAADRALWSSDGTPAGTVPLGRQAASGFAVGARGSSALIPRLRDDGGWTLDASDGTPAGTRRLTDFRPPADRASIPSGLTALADELLFTAAVGEDGEGHEAIELLASRGLGGRVRRLASFPDRFGGTPIARAGDRVFFLASEGAEMLWASDGTAAGTMPVGQPPAVDSTPWGSLNGDLLFFAQPIGGQSGRLMRAGTGPGDITTLAEVGGLPAAEQEEYFLPLGDRVVFPSHNGFWVTDGTASGTARLDDAASLLTSIVDWGRFEGKVFYLDLDRGLLGTDGTPSGTRQVCAVPLDVGPYVHTILQVGDRLLFSVGEPSARGLWTSDGQSGCELAAAGVTVDRSWQLPGAAVAFDGRLFFASDDGVHGSELWVSDGTAAGTRLFADLRPGPGESRPHRMTVAGDRLFFTATDGEHGYELWDTDGTVAGTRRLGDVAPGPRSGYPAELTAVGDRLLFRADDGTRGAELWALPLGLPRCDDAAVLCLQGDRFRVRVHWADQRTGNVGTGTSRPTPGSDRTGTFWFFDPANLELIVKVLDGGPVNGFHWVFYGGLTDVEYWLTVTDAETGATRSYRNPPGEICGRGDTTAFPAAGALGGDGFAADPFAAVAESTDSAASSHPAGLLPTDLATATAWPEPPGVVAAPAATACLPGPRTLCLLDGRFQAEVDWFDPRSGDSGLGRAVAGTDKSGFFWFFHPANLELVVKMLDGREVDGRFWVFYGALSDIQYTIRVIDTTNGNDRVYRSTPGTICGESDTTAFSD